MSLVSLLLDQDFKPFHDAENPHLSTTILGVYIFAFTPQISKHDDGSWYVRLFNVVLDAHCDAYIRNFDTHEEALQHSEMLKENGAIGTELLDRATIKEAIYWRKKIEDILCPPVTIAPSTKFTDIFDWQIAAIDAGLEISSGIHIHHAVIPLRIYTAMMAIDSSEHRCGEIDSAIRNRTMGKFITEQKETRDIGGHLLFGVTPNHINKCTSH